MPAMVRTRTAPSTVHCWARNSTRAWATVIRRVVVIATERSSPPVIRSRCAAILALVDDDREHDDHALDDLLREGRDVEQVQSGVERADDEGADDRAPHSPDAAGEAGPADDGRGDRVEDRKSVV